MWGMSEPVHESVSQQLMDVTAVSVVVGAVFGILTPIATLFTIVWLGIRIYESDTVQKLLGRSPERPTEPPDDEAR